MIVIVLLGIFLVLLLLIRSLWSSLCITGSLIGANFAAIFLSNQLFAQWFHFVGFNPFIPFFSFIIIVALGVDYSIFLMAQVGEYHDLSPQDAIVEACR
jgi:RND superfamily putative drug exporter